MEDDRYPGGLPTLTEAGSPVGELLKRYPAALQALLRALNR